jgi:hypothetical protein
MITHNYDCLITFNFMMFGFNRRIMGVLLFNISFNLDDFSYLRPYYSSYKEVEIEKLISSF